MRIAVVGLGKIGLPLAVHYARGGHAVVGVDVNPRTVALVNRGEPPFPGEAHLADYLPALTAAASLRATTDYADAIPGADAVIVVVPLVVDSQSRPDFAIMDAATRSIAAHLTPGTLVSYETTLPVGTTRGRYKPLIERHSGLVEGRDFDVVFSPERVLTGRVFADLARYPKLVGGLSEAGEERGVRFYRSVLSFHERDDLPRPNGVWPMGGAEAAEMAKLAETTYRDVNIGLANQFARYADRIGIDVARVIEACNSQPYSHIHRPGIAVGGHCIPVYPRLYLAGDPDATIVSTARAANAAMPAYAVHRAASMLGSLEGLRVAVLGAAYRGGVKETAFSGVVGVVDALRAAGARPLVHDPLYADAELVAFGWEPYHLGEQVDVAIVQADHAAYAALRPGDLPGVRFLVDGRAITDPLLWVGTPRITIGGGGAVQC
ncbi:nucleotide sugar dehydrogenase [Schaalia meyeri]|uniref:nucleotide sugar dehydrogenase n=1 Tax=Schaalia meyeri TaxID=52773 RepID=UPI000680567F|nr:nucleotide sugar dehydrogenase [Schaalia meyeri]AKU64592.1 nucleotide sugar dehydrogenase [Schaalia meyeri]OFQ24803.1 nucleotide sugar dehydrogenase [Actinomyces sp. HMSC062G12]